MTRITPVMMVADVAGSAAFYALLGLDESAQETSRTWASMAGTGGSLGLHVAAAGEAGRVSFQVTLRDGEMDAVHASLAAHGHGPTPITDETFGRYFTVADPDGYVVQVNEAPEDLARSYETEESRSLLE
ncbi:VOC family protein [Microbacterium sp.]|uniref:VOC family protein n=1 Tax=Microbacterium sp. TaxID=51671 RepID=UPI0028123169|nr:VOC family protein [Microbacterium sp.]